jgi:membrane protease YdiL (CAAX protease family)
MFAVWHGDMTDRVVSAFFSGLALAWLALRVGSIVPGAIAHTAWNATIDVEGWLLGPDPTPVMLAEVGLWVALASLCVLSLELRWRSRDAEMRLPRVTVSLPS